MPAEITKESSLIESQPLENESLLLVKKLHPDAKLPTVGYTGLGADLGYDLYALEDVTLQPLMPSKVRTGIAVEAIYKGNPDGLIFEDRSSMASKGIIVGGGVIDPQYRGELLVNLIYITRPVYYDNGITGAGLDWPPYEIKAGDKITQALPKNGSTGTIKEVDKLSNTDRGSLGFGSTDKRLAY